MKYALALAGLALEAAAYPSVLGLTGGEDAMARLSNLERRKATSIHDLDRRGIGLPSTEVARGLSAARDNCGTIPCAYFNATEQYVSTTGSHAWAAPGADEIRGPCPGLNAAANHGYLSHSGVTTLQETIVGLGAAFGLGADAAAFLATYAIIFDGDPVLGQWSIGGPPPSDPLTSGLLGGAQGLSYSHNIYEGDVSIGRNDAYLNHNDAYSLNVTRFASAFSTGLSDDRYTLDRFAQHWVNKTYESIATNPLYFSAPFATLVVSPVAYNFVINLMSNHSEEYPGGYINGDMFKTFFAVEGEYPNFTWNPGHERIPDNWYRRPTGVNAYGLLNIAADLAQNWLAYPDGFRLGGNINGVNTFAGVDLGDLTGGAYQLADLLDLSGSNGACYITQLVQAITPNALDSLLGAVSPLLDVVNDLLTPVLGNLSCPAIEQYDQTLFNKFPGYHYSPTGYNYTAPVS